MISGVADKTEILRFFFRKYGSINQVHNVGDTLKDLLTGSSEVESLELFEAYCQRMQRTYGKHPIAEFKAHEREQRRRRDDGEAGPRRKAFVPAAPTKGMLRSKSYAVADAPAEAVAAPLESKTFVVPKMGEGLRALPEAGRKRARALREQLALDVKVILKPPCIFH
jgi:hypothetical protein